MGKGGAGGAGLEALAARAQAAALKLDFEALAPSSHDPSMIGYEDRLEKPGKTPNHGLQGGHAPVENQFDVGSILTKLKV